MMKTVYYTSSFVPEELIAACGCRPLRLDSAAQNALLSQTEGMCPFVEAWLAMLLGSDKTEPFAAIFVTTCDQMRRAFDLYCHRSSFPAFLLNVPAVRSPQGLDYFRQELERLRGFLCGFSGTVFDESLLKTRISVSMPQTASSGQQVRHIAIIGESVPESVHKSLNAAADSSNTGIILDITDKNQTARFCQPPHTPGQDPLDELANHIFYLPAVWRRPNEAFYHHLAETIEKHPVNGLIVLHYVCCDHWHSAVYELRKRLAIPVLQIDLDGSDALSASAASRVQAFTEMLAE